MRSSRRAAIMPACGRWLRRCGRLGSDMSLPVSMTQISLRVADDFCFVAFWLPVVCATYKAKRFAVTLCSFPRSHGRRNCLQIALSVFGYDM